MMPPELKSIVQMRAEPDFSEPLKVIIETLGNFKTVWYIQFKKHSIRLHHKNMESRLM